MFRFLSALVFMAPLAAPASAQVALPCDWQARADAIVEPWEDNTATFAQGAIRVAVLDVLEPAASSAYLLVIHPPYDEIGARTCSVIAQDENLGYAGFNFEDLTAGYDPATGLTLKVPAIIYMPEQSFQSTTLVSITINQATGRVDVSQAFGNE